MDKVLPSYGFDFNLRRYNAGLNPMVGPGRYRAPCHRMPVKLSVGVTGHVFLLEIDGLFTQGSRPGRTSGESVGGIFEMDSSDWSNGIRYHTFDARPDTEFNSTNDGSNCCR